MATVSFPFPELEIKEERLEFSEITTHRKLIKDRSILWCIFNKEKHEYQVGKGFIKLNGKREDIFIALMLEYNSNSEPKIFIQTISKTTNIDAHRVRIEIAAINKNLRKKSNLELVGSGKGYYTLEKFSTI